MIGHDTGCITTLDKNQWIGKAVDKVYSLPVMADCQFAALALGAHPYKLAQLHWHASPFEQAFWKSSASTGRRQRPSSPSYLDEVKAGPHRDTLRSRRRPSPPVRATSSLPKRQLIGGPAE